MRIKNTLLLVSISLSFFCFSNLTPNTQLQLEKSENNQNKKNSFTLLNENGNPKPILLELLDNFNIKHDGTTKNIIEITQKEWLRNPNQERWNLEVKTENQENKVLEIFKKIGCINEISPKLKNYDYVLFMGALEKRMKLRFDYLLKLYNQGIRFKNLVFLGGERPRDPEHEDMKNWNITEQLPKTEFEIMKFIFEHTNFPNEFSNQVKLTYINTPMQKTTDGKLRRPNTGDTINEWLKLNPMPGKCLVISNNPYVGYQDCVTKTLLPLTFEIETVGCAALDNEPIAVLKDNLARWLYQENIFKKNK